MHLYAAFDHSIILIFDSIFFFLQYYAFYSLRGSELYEF